MTAASLTTGHAPLAQPAASDVPAPSTEMIFVTPPDGWVVSVWRGGTIELAEFTPPGQVADAYVDLLGYSVLPKIPGRLDTWDRVRAEERKAKSSGCRVIANRSVQRTEGWLDTQNLCLGREGGRDPDLVELDFGTTTMGAAGVYRVWRTWRGSPAEFQAMVKARTGLDAAPVTGAPGRTAIDEAALDRAFAALRPDYWRDIARAQICDVRTPASCATLASAMPPAAREAIGREPEALVAGFYAEGLNTMSREQFRAVFKAKGPDDGAANRVIVVVNPADYSWTDKDATTRTLQLVAVGQAADGGVFVFVDPKTALTDEQRAQVRAHVLISARRLWRPGASPSIVKVALPR